MQRITPFDPGHSIRPTLETPRDIRYRKQQSSAKYLLHLSRLLPYFHLQANSSFLLSKSLTFTGEKVLLLWLLLGILLLCWLGLDFVAEEELSWW